MSFPPLRRLWTEESVIVYRKTNTHDERAMYGIWTSSIETGHLAKNFNFLFISKIYSTIFIQCSSVISPIFQKIARCPISIHEAPYVKL